CQTPPFVIFHKFFTPSPSLYHYRQTKRRGRVFHTTPSPPRIREEPRPYALPFPLPSWGLGDLRALIIARMTLIACSCSSSVSPSSSKIPLISTASILRRATDPRSFSFSASVSPRSSIKPTTLVTA